MVKNYNNKMIEFVCSIYNNNNNQRVNDPEYLWELGEICIYIKNNNFKNHDTVDMYYEYINYLLLLSGSVPLN